MCFQDEFPGGPSHLKISPYLPFPCEFYFNGHNAIKVQLEKRGLAYRMKDNAIIWVEDPAVLDQISQSITGRQKCVPTLFSNRLVFVLAYLRGFWINARASDCPIA